MVPNVTGQLPWSCGFGELRASSHMRLRAPDHITSSTLIGGKGGASIPSSLPSQYTWGTNGVCECQDGCKVYMDLYKALNGSCFMVTWGYFQKPFLGGRPNTKPRDQCTPNAHNRWFVLFYHVWGHAWIEIHWNSIRLRARHRWLHTTLEGL